MDLAILYPGDINIIATVDHIEIAPFSQSFYVVKFLAFENQSKLCS